MATELENLVPEADVEVEGMRGPKGDKGDSYVLTEADKEEIARKVDKIVDSETDKTLSISGKPADAKAAGDAINDLKADLSQNNSIVRTNIAQNKEDDFTGEVLAKLNIGLLNYDSHDISVSGIWFDTYSFNSSTQKIVSRTSTSLMSSKGTFYLHKGDVILSMSNDYVFTVIKFSAQADNSITSGYTCETVATDVSNGGYEIPSNGYYFIQVRYSDNRTITTDDNSRYDLGTHIVLVKKSTYLYSGDFGDSVTIPSELIVPLASTTLVYGTILINYAKSRAYCSPFWIEKGTSIVNKNGYRFGTNSYNKPSTLVRGTPTGWTTDGELKFGHSAFYNFILAFADNANITESNITDLVENFELNKPAVWASGEDDEDIDTQEYSGTDFSIGGAPHGILVTDIGNAPGVYVEDSSKSAVTATGTYTPKSWATFTGTSGHTHVAVTGTFTTPQEFGGFIYNGYVSATQGSNNHDELIKKDGKDYYLTFYAKGLEDGQQVRFRIRDFTALYNIYNYYPINKEKPFNRVKLSAETIAEKGSLGVGFYFYGITQSFNCDIYIAISTEEYKADYIGLDEAVPAQMTACHVVADSTVSVRRMSRDEGVIEKTIAITDERYDARYLSHDDAEKKELLSNIFYDSEIKHTEVRGDYRFNAVAFDTANNKFYVLGGANDRGGSSKIMRFTDWSNPTQDAESNIIQAGHSNDITYDPVNDRLLIACGQNLNDGAGENQYSNTVKVVDPSTMEITDTITFDSSWVVQGVEYADGYVYIFSTVGSTYTVQKRSLDFATIVKTKTYEKADALAWAGYTDGRNLFFQGMAYNPKNGILYHITSGRGRYSNTYGHYYNGVLLGLDENLNFIHAISFNLDAREELQGYVFGGNLYDYVLSDGVYGVYRVIPKRIQATHTRDYIPPNSDLNDYISIGEYFCNNAENSATISNNPNTTSGFTLSVRPNSIGCRMQLLFANNADIYVRVFDATTWTEWKKITTSAVGS